MPFSINGAQIGPGIDPIKQSHITLKHIWIHVSVIKGFVMTGAYMPQSEKRARGG
jgi:hypothetical protein